MLAQYTEELTKIAMMMGVNITYSVLCITIAIMFMILGYKLFDKITPFDTAEMLAKDPKAVGIFYGAVVLAVGVCSGIVIGMSCN